MDHNDNDFNPGNGDDYNVGNDDDVDNDTDCVERDFETSRTAVEEIVPIQFTASHLAIIITCAAQYFLTGLKTHHRV